MPVEHPCRTCGACCAFFRVSFHWSEAAPALGGMGRDACHAQVAAALRVVIHVVRDPGGGRRVAQVGVFHRGPDGLVEILPGATMTRSGLDFGEGAGLLRAAVGW